MKCKKCHSEKVQLKMVEGPSATGIRYKHPWLAPYYWIMKVVTFGIYKPKMVKVKSTVFRKIAFCKNCGYSWNIKSKHGK